MNNTSKYDRIVSLIESAFPLLQAEIKNAESGVEAVDSLRSLNFMKARLDEIEKMLRSGSIQKDERYKGSMGHLVVDTWPRNHPLGSKITEIEYEFYRLS